MSHFSLDRLLIISVFKLERNKETFGHRRTRNERMASNKHAKRIKDPVDYLTGGDGRSFLTLASANLRRKTRRTRTNRKTARSIDNCFLSLDAELILLPAVFQIFCKIPAISLSTDSRRAFECAQGSDFGCDSFVNGRPLTTKRCG